MDDRSPARVQSGTTRRIHSEGCVPVSALNNDSDTRHTGCEDREAVDASVGGSVTRPCIEMMFVLVALQPLKLVVNPDAGPPIQAVR